VSGITEAACRSLRIRLLIFSIQYPGLLREHSDHMPASLGTEQETGWLVPIGVDKQLGSKWN